MLLILIAADFEHYLIPDEVHWALLPLGAAHRFLAGAGLAEMTAGLLLGLGLGLSLRYGYSALRKKEGLGWGDVKFLAVAGLWLGLEPFVPFLFFSGLFGVATGLLWRRLGRGKLFPFGPSLALALFLCVVYPEASQAFWDLYR
jgi:prepilin signal peptidase PulO-like enzyme (type II secretory pathway)